MKRVLGLLLFCTCILSLSAEQSPEGLRRFGLFIGSNDGGRDRVLLRYAEKDALTLAAVMQEVGGLEAEDSLILLEPAQEEVLRGFAHLDETIERVKGKVRRIEFLLYYSGHSDEQGLLLGGERITYTELKEAMGDLEADVKIAILDSCSSGAFTRLKGGRRRSPFLLDESAHMEGHAFLTSSSADEAAQESDLIRSSFFSHYLVSGLRGAADVTGDGRITLNEAYHFAYSETLARTESTQAGPQHPSYNINLSGTGDLTLTDIRSTSAGIIIGEGVEGRLYVRDARDNLMVELAKRPGASVELALPAGYYRITLNLEGELAEASIALHRESRMRLESEAFTRKEAEPTRSRGTTGEDLPPEPTVVPLGVSLIPGLQTTSGEGIIHNVSLNVLIGSTYAVHGLELASILNFGQEEVIGAQLAGVGNMPDGDITGAQMAGVFNLVGGESNSVQYAGVFNLVRGDASIVQGAGVFNLTEGSVSGMQGAGVFNIAVGKIEGFQAAGSFNRAAEVKGAQLGTLNLSEAVQGTQIGLINIASGDVRGAQIGLINIARDIQGVPLGLININRYGLHASAWLTDIGTFYLGLQTGTPYLYTLLYGGIKESASPSLYTAGIGMGFNVPVGSFYVSADLSAKSVFNDRQLEKLENEESFEPVSVFLSIRTLAGFNFLRRFSLFGGVLLETHLPGFTRKTALHTGSPIQLAVWNTSFLLYPKLFLGLRF